MYLVIAYRWGWTNNEWYIVYGGPDRDKACEMATSEAEDRAGKYGCAVYEFSADGTHHKLIDYESSAYGETEPEHNERIEYFKRLGQFTENLASGSVLLPDPSDPRCLKYTGVVVPQLVKDEVTRQQKLLEAWRAARAAYLAKTKPPVL